MTISLIITWISIFFYDQIVPFIFFLPFLIFFSSFFSLPQLYLPPHGIILEIINSNYQLVILLLLCFSIWWVPSKFLLLLLGLILGILQVIQTTDWFNLYVAFELLLILVFIAGVKTNWKARHEYFEGQIIASCVILFGITRLYADNGNLIIGKSTDLFWSIGLLMKLGIWPFHRILYLYTSIGDRYLYLFTVCILSKAFLYCFRFCDPDFARIFLLANLLKSSTKIISDRINDSYKKNESDRSGFQDLNLPSLMSSNSLLGFLILRNSWFAPIYLLHFTFSQILLFSKYEKSFYLLASGMPFSLGFFMKILALREINSNLETTLFLLDNLFFCIASNYKLTYSDDR